MNGSRTFHFFDHPIERRGVGSGLFNEIRFEDFERPRRISEYFEKFALMFAHPVSAFAEESFDCHARLE